MTAAREEIIEIVERETRAWDSQDASLLLSIFQRDMVWPWPRSYSAHDPAEWTLVMGRFDAGRWRQRFQDLFDTHELVHNRRRIEKVEVSAERVGAFAVVDVDTLWRAGDGGEQHWLGRACKVYALVEEGWKMTVQTGLLRY